MPDDSGLSKELLASIEKRIEVMEAPGYVFPEEFSAADWTGAVMLIVISLGSIIAGAWM